ncbi:MAG: TetR/AcrR family transcriptional regulator [Hyphomicrobiales bacterium]
MAQTERDAGWRGSAELWLNAAHELLLEQGIDAVKILPLAQKLNLSRTSFYWFFTDRDALLTALLSRWRDKNTGNVLKQANAYAETVVEAVLNVNDLWFDGNLFDAKLEFAVRSWALQSPEVLKAVQEADSTRIAALTGVFTRFGIDAHLADVRARTMYLTQIGYISMQTREDLPLRLSRIPQYVEVFTGRAAETRELDRFYARHAHGKM